MPKPTITETDLCRAAKRLRTSTAEVETVAQVESAGDGFYPDGFPVILFERHLFRRFTNGKFNASHPHLSGSQGGYGKAGQHQQDKFNEAFALDPDAAMKSCSWGKFQILGSNYEVCGFNSVGEFVEAMKESEGRQLDAFCEFVIHNGLGDELRNHDWARFARGYNGPAYKKNKYDTKLANAYEKFKKRKIHCGENSTAVPSTTPLQPTVFHNKEGGESAAQPSIIQPTGEAPASLVAVQTPVVEVEQVSAEQEPPKSEPDIIDRINTRWVAVQGGIGTLATGALSWVVSSSLQIALAFFAAATVITVVVVISTAVRNEFKDRRAERTKQAEREIQMEREKRAHEIQKLTIESAMNKDLNTVRVVPQPLQNSDAPGATA